MTKQFLITIKAGEDTRDVRDQRELITRIRLEVTSLVIDHTRGPVPEVKVIPLPDLEEWDVERDVPFMLEIERDVRKAKGKLG